MFLQFVVYYFKCINVIKMKHVFILVIVLVISIIVLFYRYQYVNEIEVITFETDLSHMNLSIFKKSLKKNNYEYNVLTNDKWLGFGNKIRNIHKYIKKLPDDKIIIVSDARDVISVNHTSQQLLSKIKPLIKNKIIISTEIGCCVKFQFKPGEYRTKKGEVSHRTFDVNNDYTPDIINKWKDMFSNHAAKHKIQYKDDDRRSIHINAGIYMGTVKNIKKMYDLLNIDNLEDDQILISEIFYLYPEMFLLDYHRSFFSNSHVWDTHNKKSIKEDTGCPFVIGDKKKLKDTNSNTYPYFIHTPGKHWNCYNAVKTYLNLQLS